MSVQMVESEEKFLVFYPSLISSVYQERICCGSSLVSILTEISKSLDTNMCCYYQPYLWIFGSKCYRFSIFDKDLEKIEFSDFLPVLRKRILRGEISFNPVETRESLHSTW